MTRRILVILIPLLLILLLAAVWLGPQVYRYLRTRSYRFAKLGE